VLLGLYPVLYIWSANRAQQPAYVVIPSLLATLLILSIAFMLATVFLRSLHRAALTITVLALVCLSYGHWITFSRQIHLEPHHRYTLPAAALVTLALLALILRRPAPSAGLVKGLNLVSAGLVILPLLTAGPYYISSAWQARAARQPLGQAQPATIDAPGSRPDIYFIILDNYGRQDVLRSQAGYDNSALVAALKERGFVFPDCAQGNYPATALVIASILNMDYLDQLGNQPVDFFDESRYSILGPHIKNSLVIQKFRAYGYQTVTFRGYMDLIDIQDVDYYIDFAQSTTYNERLETYNFQNLYFKTTIFYPINEALHVYPDLLVRMSPKFLSRFFPDQDFLEPRFYKVYQQNIYAFDALERLPQEYVSPKFVYAHIYAAHWPYMLRPDGSMRLPFSEGSSTEAYLDGVLYTNSRILPVIDSILANSATPPVIILQGDHADGWIDPVQWSGKDRLKILSAYYLPGGGEQLLSDTITPVNNFRLVFRHYFNEPLDMLSNTSYYLEPGSGDIKTAPESCISSVNN
jgi:hypothetical protein